MVGARGPRPGPKAAGLGNSAGRVTGPPVAQRYPGRGEVGRPRYLEDEGGPRPGSHLRRAPPARPPGPNPTERIQSRRARGRSSGRRSQARVGSPRRGSQRRPQNRHGKQQPSPEMATRGVSALRKRGRGRGAPAGRRDAEDAGAPGSGRSGSQTEPPPALWAPKRGPVAGRGGGEGEERREEKMGRGERGRRGGQAGGAATLSSHPPKPCTFTTDSHP